MNISTFQDDLLELQDFAKQLEKFIDTEHDFVEGSLVVALSSRYGSGKSTFLKMWCSAIGTAEESEAHPLVISLSAWESDYNGDPLYALSLHWRMPYRKKVRMQKVYWKQQKILDGSPQPSGRNLSTNSPE